ncbi:hypothetical protein ACWGIV_03985 [Streptomyces sp. NPDC054844]
MRVVAVQSALEFDHGPASVEVSGFYGKGGDLTGSDKETQEMSLPALLF